MRVKRWCEYYLSDWTIIDGNRVFSGKGIKNADFAQEAAVYNEKEDDDSDVRYAKKTLIKYQNENLCNDTKDLWGTPNQFAINDVLRLHFSGELKFESIDALIQKYSTIPDLLADKFKKYATDDTSIPSDIIAYMDKKLLENEYLIPQEQSAIELGRPYYAKKISDDSFIIDHKLTIKK